MRHVYDCSLLAVFSGGLGFTVNVSSEWRGVDVVGAVCGFFFPSPL